MIERIRCIPVFCPWGLKFYSLSPKCEACYRKCLRLRQACARRRPLSPGEPSGEVLREKGGQNAPPDDQLTSGTGSPTT